MGTQHELQIRLAADGSGLIGVLRTSTGEVRRFSTDVKKAGDDAAAAFGKSAQSAGQLSGLIDSARRSVIGFLGIRFGGQMVSEIINMADSWGQVTSRIRLATDTTSEQIAVQDRLISISRRSFRAVGETAEIYLRSAGAMREVGFAANDTLNMVEAVSLGLVVSATNAQAGASVIDQFGKAMETGTLRGEAFNTVIASAPELAKALAAGLGVTRAELRRMAEAGELTANRVLPALTSQLEDLRQKADSMPTTVGDALTILSSAFTVLLGATNETWGATALLATGIELLADHLTDLLTIGLMVGTLYGVRMVNWLAASVSAWAAKTTQLLAFRAAAVAAAGGSTALSMGLGAGALAAGTLSLALSKIAPWITLIAAGGSLIYLAYQQWFRGTDEVRQATDALDASLAKLEQAKGLSAQVVALAEVESKAADVRTKLAETEQEIARLEARFQAASERARGFGQGAENAAIRAGQLAGELIELRERQDDYKKSLEETEPEINRQAAALAAQQQALTSQAAAMSNLGTMASAEIGRLILASVTLGNEGAEARRKLGPFIDALFDLAVAADQASRGVGSMNFGKVVSGLESELQTLQRRRIELEKGEQAGLEWAAAQQLGADATDEQRTSVAALLGQIAAQRTAVTQLTEAEKRKSVALREANQAKREGERAARDFARTQQSLVDQAADLAAQLRGPAAVAQREYEKAVDAAGAELAEMASNAAAAGLGIEQLAAANEALLVIEEAQARIRDDKLAALARENDIVGQLTQQYRDEAAALGLTGRELQIHNELVRARQAAQQLGRSLTEQEIADIRRLAGGFYDLNEAFETNEAAAQRWRDLLTGAGADVRNVFAELFTGQLNGMQDFADRMVQIAQRMVAEMIAEFMRLGAIKLVTGQGGGWGELLGQAFGGGSGGFGNVIGSLFGGGNGGVGNMLGGLFGAGSAMAGTAAGYGVLASSGMAASMGSYGVLAGTGYAGGAAPWLTGLAGYGGTYGATAGAAGTVGIGGAATGGAAAGSGMWAGIMAAMPWAALVAMGMMYADKFMAQGWNPNSASNRDSLSATNFGVFKPLPAILTSMDNRILQSLGMSERLANLLTGASIASRLFGHRDPRVVGGGYDATFGSEGVGGSMFADIYQRGGVFRSSRRWTETTEGLDEDIETELAAIWDGIRRAIQQQARRLGTELPESISAAYRAQYDEDGEFVSGVLTIFGRQYEGAWEEIAGYIAGYNLAAVINAALDPDQIGGDAIALAERWSSSADVFADGAQALVNAAVDMVNGIGLLRDEGTLADIADLIDRNRFAGESLVATYDRLVQSAANLETAQSLTGVTLDLAREAFVQFAADITEAAGGLDAANALWDSFFSNFYGDTERNVIALQQLLNQRDTGLTGIGLDPSTSMAEFRTAFEAVMGELTADQIVQWLEVGDVLARATQAQREYAAAIVDYSTDLATIMLGVDQAMLAATGAVADWAGAMAEVEARNTALIARAAELGASEEELARVREFGLARVEELAAAEAAARGAYHDFIQQFADTSMFRASIAAIQRQERDALQRANQLARAAGMQGAAERDLVAIHEWAARQVGAAIAELQQRTEDLIAEWSGSGLTSIEEQIRRLEAQASAGAGGLDRLSRAIGDIYAEHRRGVEGIRAWLDGQLLGDLSHLTPDAQLAEAWQQLNDLVNRAPNDADAMNQLPAMADAYLRLLRGHEASGVDYNTGAEAVRALLGPLANLVFPQAPDDTGGPQTYIVTPSAELQALYEQRDALLAAQETAHRAALAERVALHLADLAEAVNAPVLALAGVMGVSLTQLATDLGVNLENITGASVQALASLSGMLGITLTDLTGALGLELTSLAGGVTELTTQLGIDLSALTVQSTGALAALARDLGVDLTELTTAVGVEIGALTSSQSLLNQTFAAELASLPDRERDLLEPLLAAITTATTEADANTAIGELESAVNALSPAIRDQLAPYLTGVFPASAMEELDYLDTIDSNIRTLADIQPELLDELERIANNLSAANRAAGVESFAVGTGFVSRDMLANIHRGEAILPAEVNAFAQRSGMTIGPVRDDSSMLAAIRNELAALRTAVSDLDAGNRAGHERTADVVADESALDRMHREDQFRMAEVGSWSSR